MPSLALTEFKIAHAICEIRFPNAYVFWDKSGELWTKCETQWPDLINKKSEPNRTTFTIGNSVELGVLINRAFIKYIFPKSSLEDFVEYCNNFFKILFSTIDIREFERVGFRINYIKDFKNKDEISEFVKKIDELHLPKIKNFGIEATVILPSYIFRLEGETLGIRANIEFVSKEFELEVPLEIGERESIHKEFTQLAIDYDYYTLKTTNAGQINISEWINHAYHSIKRDHESFWKGVK